MRRLGAIAAVVLALLVVAAQPASAATIYTDSFEDGNLDEYTFVKPSRISIQSSGSLSGSYSLRMESNDITDQTIAISTTGLDHYPEPGDTWIEYVKFNDTTAQHEYIWAASDVQYDPTGYRLRFDTDANEVQLRRGGFYGSLDDSLPLPDSLDNTKLKATIHWRANGDRNVLVETADGSTVLGWLNASGTSRSSGGVAYVSKKDDIGSSMATAIWDSPAPGDLEVREQAGSHDLVQPDVVNITLYQGTTIMQRSTTNGSVPLTGLAPDAPVVANIESTNYTTRQTILEGTLGTQTAYLRNASASSVEPTFTLRDFSGRYPPEDSILLIQRQVGGNWTTVAGDYFGGVNQVSPLLRPGQRYRLVVLNAETDTKRIAGPYTPTANPGVVEVVLRQGSITLEGLPPAISWNPTNRVLPATTSADLSIRIESRATPITTWSVEADQVDPTGSRTTLDQSTQLTAGGTYTQTFDLSGASGSTVSINVSWTLTDGTSDYVIRNYTVRQPSSNDHAILPTLATIGSRLPSQHVDAFEGFVAIAVTVLGTGAVAATVPLSTEALGGIAVAFLAGFAVIAWLPYTVLFVALVAWLALAGIQRGI